MPTAQYEEIFKNMVSGVSERKHLSRYQSTNYEQGNTTGLPKPIYEFLKPYNILSLQILDTGL
jgi:hypothetical protein